MTNDWQHRLLKLDYLPAGELAQRFNLLNPRSHPLVQRDATEASLERLKWIDEVSLSTNGDGPPDLAQNPDAVLFDGHERVEIVLSRFGPDALVPVRWYGLSKEETDLALLVKDQTSAMAEIIPEKMAALMERAKALTFDKPGLEMMLNRLKVQIANGYLNGTNDPNEEWKGMPEFEQEDKTSYQSIHVHFKNAEEVTEFGKLIGQSLTNKTNSIWYSQREQIDN